MMKKCKCIYDIIVLLGMATVIVILNSFGFEEFVAKYIMVFLATAYFLGKIQIPKGK